MGCVFSESPSVWVCTEFGGRGLLKSLTVQQPDVFGEEAVEESCCFGTDAAEPFPRGQPGQQFMPSKYKSGSGYSAEEKHGIILILFCQ